MLSTVKTRCHCCHKQFLTKRAYFIFNKGAGYNSFCSKKCHYKSRLLGKTIICGNPNCNKKFYRAPGDISTNNYCSKSCAAIINNQKYPKWPKRYCAKCGKEFKNRESKYCSRECGYSTLYNNKGHIATKYTSEEVKNEIMGMSKKLSRTPTKRELGNISHAAIRMFGSWNNAITTLGLTPHRSHDHRMYRRTPTKAADGHLCDSISEAIVDNWLHKNKIGHTRNVSYPTTNHRADWAIGDNIFIEYFGLAKDSPRYDREIKVKQGLCKKGGILLIEIYPSDLYPKLNLDKKIKFLVTGQNSKSPS